MFKSLSHLFIFMRGVKLCCGFIDLHAAVQLPQYHLLMRLCLFPIFYFCLLSQRLTVGVWVRFRAFHSAPLIHMSGFVPVPHRLDYCSFVILSEVREGYASCPTFPQDCYDNSGSFMGLTCTEGRCAARPAVPLPAVPFLFHPHPQDSLETSVLFQDQVPGLPS